MPVKNGQHSVEVVAKVQSMELNLDYSGSYKLQLEDGSTVHADFTPTEWDHLQSMHNRGRYPIKFVGAGDYSDGTLKRITSVDLTRTHRVIPPEDPEEPTLLHRLAEIRKKYPADIWDNVPTDGAKNMHYYLYGRPKMGE